MGRGWEPVESRNRLRIILFSIPRMAYGLPSRGWWTPGVVVTHGDVGCLMHHFSQGRISAERGNQSASRNNLDVVFES